MKSKVLDCMCQLQLLVALISNMIGRVNPLVVQSPLDHFHSSGDLVCLCKHDTFHGSQFCGLFTISNEQGNDGVASRCCGKQCPRLGRAVEVEKSHVRNKRRVQYAQSDAHQAGASAPSGDRSGTMSRLQCISTRQQEYKDAQSNSRCIAGQAANETNSVKVEIESQDSVSHWHGVACGCEDLR